LFSAIFDRLSQYYGYRLCYYIVSGTDSALGWMKVGAQVIKSEVETYTSSFRRRHWHQGVAEPTLTVDFRADNFSAELLKL
jgi:hypothetical protein